MLSLLHILEFIQENEKERSYFKKDGNKDLYLKFKQDRSLRNFHTTVHQFISLNLPIPSKKKLQVPVPRKSILKQVEY